MPQEERIIAFDPSYLPKSGKRTPDTHTSSHRWLARPATSNSPTAIEAIQKLVFLKDLSVADWNTSVLNTNRGKRLVDISVIQGSSSLLVKLG